jgi:alkanesulfonate monooxygenase SsuD/methylene tetrahydromethanopterin reductase-like flavin-dependent oxidoreductase (luciferase family)
MDTFYPHYAAYFRNHTPSQYRAREISRDAYEQLAGRDGPLFVGSPQQIVDKILLEYELFGHQRFLAQIDIGGLPYAKVAQVIELIASDVMPVVQRATAARG